ncbi:MAG: hypothetical protein GKR91_05070 [Pseudomonadales bacterium]|nr:hypothetical protein [Pseudomonadales bacterium]
MKILIGIVAVALSGFIGMHVFHGPVNSALHGGEGDNSNARMFLHGGGHENAERAGDIGDDSLTFSIRQNDYELCTDQFWVDLYDITVEEFAVGADSVGLAEYENSVFTYVRTSENFPYGDREGWVDHIKAIPAQMIDIVREDPAVLDSCANFSVALVGPP